MKNQFFPFYTWRRFRLMRVSVLGIFVYIFTSCLLVDHSSFANHSPSHLDPKVPASQGNNKAGNLERNREQALIKFDQPEHSGKSGNHKSASKSSHSAASSSSQKVNHRRRKYFKQPKGNQPESSPQESIQWQYPPPSDAIQPFIYPGLPSADMGSQPMGAQPVDASKSGSQGQAVPMNPLTGMTYDNVQPWYDQGFGGFQGYGGGFGAGGGYGGYGVQQQQQQSSKKKPTPPKKQQPIQPKKSAPPTKKATHAPPKKYRPPKKQIQTTTVRYPRRYPPRSSIVDTFPPRLSPIIDQDLGHLCKRGEPLPNVICGPSEGICPITWDCDMRRGMDEYGRCCKREDICPDQTLALSRGICRTNVSFDCPPNFYCVPMQLNFGTVNMCCNAIKPGTCPSITLNEQFSTTVNYTIPLFNASTVSPLTAILAVTIPIPNCAGSCNHDYECPGVQKCCQGTNGCPVCVIPSFAQSVMNPTAHIPLGPIHNSISAYRDFPTSGFSDSALNNPAADESSEIAVDKVAKHTLNYHHGERVGPSMLDNIYQEALFQLNAEREAQIKSYGSDDTDIDSDTKKDKDQNFIAMGSLDISSSSLTNKAPNPKLKDISANISPPKSNPQADVSQASKSANKKLPPKISKVASREKSIVKRDAGQSIQNGAQSINVPTITGGGMLGGGIIQSGPYYNPYPSRPGNQEDSSMLAKTFQEAWKSANVKSSPLRNLDQSAYMMAADLAQRIKSQNAELKSSGRLNEDGTIYVPGEKAAVVNGLSRYELEQRKLMNPTEYQPDWLSALLGGEKSGTAGGKNVDPSLNLGLGGLTVGGPVDISSLRTYKPPTYLNNNGLNTENERLLSVSGSLMMNQNGDISAGRFSKDMYGKDKDDMRGAQADDLSEGNNPDGIGKNPYFDPYYDPYQTGDADSSFAAMMPTMKPNVPLYYPPASLFSTVGYPTNPAQLIEAFKGQPLPIELQMKANEIRMKSGQYDEIGRKIKKHRKTGEGEKSEGGNDESDSNDYIHELLFRLASKKQTTPKPRVTVDPIKFLLPFISNLRDRSTNSPSSYHHNAKNSLLNG